MEEYPIPNVPLAARVLWHLIRHPEFHDQYVWVRTSHPRDVVSRRLDREEESFDASMYDCGTVACAGGWTLLLAGYRVLREQNYIRYIVDPDGDRVENSRISSIAQHLLGLSHEESHFLFITATNEMAVSFLRGFVVRGLRGHRLLDHVRKLSEVDE